MAQRRASKEDWAQRGSGYRLLGIIYTILVAVGSFLLAVEVAEVCHLDVCETHGGRVLGYTAAFFAGGMLLVILLFGVAHIVEGVGDLMESHESATEEEPVDDG